MQKTVNIIFLFLLLFCPLAFGTTELWSLALMELLCFLAVGLYLIKQKISGEPIYKTPALLPLLVFLGYLLFQIVPLPPFLLQLLSPKTAELYQNSIGIIDSNIWLSLSVNKKATLLEFFRYASYVCFYFLTIQLLARKERLQGTVALIIIFLTGLSAFSIIQFFTSRGTIFWLVDVPKNSIIFGPYVNHNHYAGLMELVLPLVIALFLFLKPQVTYKQTWREKIVEIFDFQGINLYILLGFSALLIASSIILSLSRGGMISASLSLIVLIVVLSLRLKQRNKNLIIFLLIIAIFFSVSWFGWESVVERFSRLQNQQGEIYESRLEFWKDSINIIKSFTLTGSGFGTFSDIYPVFRTFISDRSVLHAHNDYLELLIEGGLIGLSLVLWFLYQLFKKSFSVFRKRHDRYSIYLFLGCFCGLISIFIHSATDFNLHIGANGLYFFFIAGLMVSAVNTKIRVQLKSTILRTEKKSRPVLALANASFILFICGAVLNLSMLLGHYYYNTIANINLNSRIAKPRLNKIHHFAGLASKWDPLSGKYHYAKANIETLLLDTPAAMESYKQALVRQPLHGEFLQRIGLIHSWLGEEKAAEKLLLAGINTDSSNPQRYQDYAEWLFSQGRKEDGLSHLNTALSLEPRMTNQKTRQYIVSMMVNNVGEKEILKVIPNKTKPMLGLADYYSKLNDFTKAEEIYLKALDCLTKDPMKNVWDYNRIHRFFLKRGKTHEALNIALKAADDIPYDPRPRIWTGRLYKKLGVTYRAREEYKMALTLEPDNKYAIRELSLILK